MVYTLDPGVSLQLALEDEFDRYAKSIGLRDSYAIELLLIHEKMCYYADGSIGMDIEFDEKTGKVKDDQNHPSVEEKKAYSLIKHMYVLKRIFEKAGYEIAKDRVRLWDEPAIEEYFKTFCPCEGATGQCSIECPKYLNCNFS